MSTRMLGDLAGLTAEEVNARFQGIVAGAELGYTQPLSDAAFSLLVRELYQAPRRFTFVDLFCGAGGSSIGLTMAGGWLLFAANHSQVSIDTHSENFRDSDHKRVNINEYDMRNMPGGAHILWASPICTEISPAGGKKRPLKTKGRIRNPDQLELLNVEGYVSKDTFEKTRATFHDVIRATEVHRFPIVIVENVVEAVRDWELFGWWLDGMQLLGYHYQIVSVSAAHVGDDLNPYAPQRRDRVYIVFNRKDVSQPIVDPRPLSSCDTCGTVQGVQWWKKPNGTLTASGRHFKVGKYGPRYGQYVYRCPNRECEHSIVTPFERPAASIIDWSDLGTRICDRPADDPLVENTLRRIKRGRDLFAAPTIVNSAHDDDRAYPAHRTPFMSRTTKVGDGLTCPPGWGNVGGLHVPPGAFIATQRTNVVPTSVWEPMTTIAAGGERGGNHHGLVVPYYTKGRATRATDALPTVTTKDRFGLAYNGDPATFDDIMQWHYRMVKWDEQARAQRFPASYVITGNGGERTAQAGNAVPSNVAQWLGEQCAEALNRTAGLW